MFELFERKTVELLEELENEEIKNADYFLKKMTLYKDLYFHPGHNKYNIKDQSLEALSLTWTAFFLWPKCK